MSRYLLSAVPAAAGMQWNGEQDELNSLARVRAVMEHAGLSISDLDTSAINKEVLEKLKPSLIKKPAMPMSEAMMAARREMEKVDKAPEKVKNENPERSASAAKVEQKLASKPVLPVSDTMVSEAMMAAKREMENFEKVDKAPEKLDKAPEKVDKAPEKVDKAPEKVNKENPQTTPQVSQKSASKPVLPKPDNKVSEAMQAARREMMLDMTESKNTIANVASSAPPAAANSKELLSKPEEVNAKQTSSVTTQASKQMPTPTAVSAFASDLQKVSQKEQDAAGKASLARPSAADTKKQAEAVPVPAKKQAEEKAAGADAKTNKLQAEEKQASDSGFAGAVAKKQAEQKEAAKKPDVVQTVFPIVNRAKKQAETKVAEAEKSAESAKITLQKIKTDSQKAVEAAEQQAKEAAEKLQSTQRQTDQQITNAKKAKQGADSALSILQQQQKKVDNLVTELHEKYKTKVSADDKVAAAKNQLDTLNEKILSLNNHIEETDTQKTQAEAALIQARKKLETETNVKISNLAAKKEKLEGDLGTAKSSAAEKEAEFTSLQGQAKTEADSLIHVQAQLEKMRAQLEGEKKRYLL